MNASSEELLIRQRLKDDFTHYAAKCLKVRTKKGSVEPFYLNTAQQFLHQRLQQQLLETKQIRALVLKGRQQGISTYVGGRYFWKVTHRRGVRAFICAHEQEATNNLFEMAQRYYDYCPLPVCPSLDSRNAKELYFGGLDSGYKNGTAGNKAVGRSQTIQYFHGSEVAFWPNAEQLSQGILQAIPDAPDTEVILESTANGVGNYFYQQWQLAEAGDSPFIPIFIPWFWQSEYQKEIKEELVLAQDEEELIEFYELTREQILWRRGKIAELSSNGIEGSTAFKQEYPCNSVEAFAIGSKDALIAPELVMRARKNKMVTKSGALVVGVDPARFGNDRTAIIRRQGRVAFGLESYSKIDGMEVAGRVYKIIKDEHPARVFVDVGGIGGPIIDRLNELLGVSASNIIVPVNFGEKRTVLDQSKYFYKRDEMWGELKQWLSGDLPVSIPDTDSLYSDLCGQKYTYSSISQLKLISKKEENLRSPDEADALALTFAMPVVENDTNFTDLTKKYWFSHGAHG